MALKDFMAEAERCSQCSYCEWVPFDLMKSWRFSKGCPSIGFNEFLSYSARGRYAVTLGLINGTLAYDKRVVDIAFQCQACGNCDVTCKICRYNLEPLEMIRELRADLLTHGQTLPQHAAVIEALRNSGNMLQKPMVARGKWAEGLDVKKLSDHRNGIVFHAGCRLSCETGQQAVARTAVSLLIRGGVDPAIMGQNETCCGGRAYNMGYRDVFSRCAETNIAAWEKANVTTVVTSCADCYHTFKRLYPVLGGRFEVLHTVEYLERLITEGRLKLTRTVPLKVTYHDPCHLGRQGEPFVPWSGNERKIFNQVVVYDPPKPRYTGAAGIYNAPRNVLRSIPGVALFEMERIREGSWCCGAGAGVREAYPEFASWTANERLEEANSTGAEAIVGACGWCEKSLLEAAGRTGGSIRVLDIAEIVAQALE
jgi:Fe-S oxidoreductase